jgi:Zn-dependent peptidase ImmA (M78 family)
VRRRFDPYRSLGALGVDFYVDDVEPDLLGYYDDGRRAVTVARGLRQVERRCTAAHEYVHAVRRDQPTCSGWHEAKQERAVARTAARLLISVDDLARALAWSTDAEEVADELWVDVDTLAHRLAALAPDEWRELASRLGKGVDG